MPTDKKTPWFSMTERPARPGVYELRGGASESGWTYWTGSEFNGAWASSEHAFAYREDGFPVFPGAMTHCKGCTAYSTGWRGLRNQTKEA